MSAPAGPIEKPDTDEQTPGPNGQKADKIDVRLDRLVGVALSVMDYINITKQATTW